MIYKTCKMLLLAGLSCLSSPAVAQTVLDPITVTGTKEKDESEETDGLGADAANETLGGYLDALPNVDSASYGEAVGRPVVRGMSGYRVKILHNDNEVSDLSAMSQDHAVAVAPRASERIELLKGPASLLYAAQAGGVVRINDSLHSPFQKAGVSGKLSGNFRADPGSHGVDGRFSFANHDWALHLAGMQQSADPYESGDGETVVDSDLRTEQAQVGLGWRPGSSSEWQLNATWLTKDYGIPNETPEATRIDMTRKDAGAKFIYEPDSIWLREIAVDLQGSDYLHDETEGGRKDGLFGQKHLHAASSQLWDFGRWTGESRIALGEDRLRVCHEHGACDDFSDAVRTGAPLGESVSQYLESTGLPYSHGHPLPDVTTRTGQLSTVARTQANVLGELTLGVNWQFRRLTPDSDNIQEQWVYPPELDPDYYDRQDDQALSLSGGVGTPRGDQAWGWELSLSYLERLPSVDELFWNGFHHATDSYIFGDPTLDKERSLNIDVDLSWAGGPHLWLFSAFYYNFQDYIYQAQAYDDAGDPLTDPFHLSPVWFTRQTDAHFVGGSLRYENTFASRWSLPLTLWAQLDLLDAKTADGDNLPRTAPANSEIGLRYDAEHWLATFVYKHVFESRILAENETRTDGYDWLSLYLQRNQRFGRHTLQFWLKGENLLDVSAQNHLSVLKETAPLPGRQITAGLGWRF